MELGGRLFFYFFVKKSTFAGACSLPQMSPLPAWPSGQPSIEKPKNLGLGSGVGNIWKCICLACRSQIKNKC